MKTGDKVGVLSNFFAGKKTYLRGKNVTIGKDITLAEANAAAIAGRLAAPIDEVAADKAAAEKAEAEKAEAEKAEAEKAAAEKAAAKKTK